MCIPSLTTKFLKTNTNAWPTPTPAPNPNRYPTSTPTQPSAAHQFHRYCVMDEKI